jgi:hypothetical protein
MNEHPLKGDVWWVVDQQGATFVVPTETDGRALFASEEAAGAVNLTLGSITVPFDMDADKLADYAVSNGAEKIILSANKQDDN